MAQPVFIAVNQTGSNIVLEQLRLTVPGSGQVTLSDFNETWRIQSDPELYTAVTNDLILINNGSTTLSKTQSLQYLTAVATSNDLTAVPSDADKTVWANVSTALGGQAGSNEKYVFKSDGHGDGYMVKNTQSISHVITVGPSGDVDYNTINEAVTAAIAGGAGTIDAAWDIMVYPGTYIEPPMTLVPDVNIIGTATNRLNMVYIVAQNPNVDLFTCYGGTISACTLEGVTDPARYLLRCDQPYSLVVLHGINIRNTSNGIHVGTGATVVATNFTYQVLAPAQGIGTGVYVDGYGAYFGANGGYFNAPSALLPYYATNPIQTCIHATNYGEVYITGMTCRVAPKDNTADVFFAENGAKITIISSEISGCGIVSHIGSSGSNTEFICQAIALTNNYLNTKNESSTGSVFVNVTTDQSSYSGVAGATLTGVVQYRSDNLTKLLGNVKYQFNTGSNVDLADYFADNVSTGICGEGIVTQSGSFTVDIAAGDGWIARPDPYDDSFWVSWDGYAGLTLPISSTNYIYYDSIDGYLKSGLSIPGDTGILLATVITDGYGIRYLHDTRRWIDNPAGRLDQYLLDTRKQMLKSGCATIEGTSSSKINVGSGTYYIALNPITIAGSGGDATFSYFYGTNGATEVASQTALNLTQYDNAGTLTTMTDGYYRSDTVILTSDNRINVIYGTQQYSSLSLAEAASLGNTPTFMEPSAFPSARVIVLKSSGIAKIVDARPQSSTSGGGAGGVSVHSALAGLDADDHTQYLLASGARSMSGALNMGGNNITNTGTIDGITVTAHASRHNPGGLDALATGTPVTISVGASPSAGSASSYALSDHQHGISVGTPVSISTSNANGSASTVARSDHQHDHGTQSDGYHHALASVSLHGFMSQSDKSKLNGIDAGANNTVISSTAPVNVDLTTASAGISTQVSRYDHKHSVNVGSPTALTVGGANSDGYANTLIRSDHTHALPAFGTTSGTFAQGNDSRFTDDRTASGLRTATTVVSISGATAPSDGYALVASSSTNAIWKQIVQATRTINTTNGISGGGPLTSDLTLSPTYGSSANTVCQGNDARLSDDRTASGIRTATTIVSTSSSTAPQDGYVLVASSGTAASWIDLLSSTSPANITKATASAGTSHYAARQDHKHDISTASAVGLTVGGSNAEGSLTTLARSDHTHSLPAFGTGVGTFCQGNDSRLSDDRTASGLRSATTVVSVSAATAPVLGQVLTATSSTVATWQTPLALSSSAPANVTKAAASAGSSTDAAKADHKHDITTATASSLSVGGSNAEGSATSLARSDHTHSLPAFGTTAGTFAQGNDSRFTNDRTASGLRSATTIVSVSGATAPVLGQFLVATSGTNATWQTISLHGDFANGGDTAGAARSLGNIDGYDLTFKTNNLTRLTIRSDGYVTAAGRLQSSYYVMGTDLSLTPITSGQSVLTSWYGLQLVGNKQSTVDYTASNIGNVGDYGVIIPNQQAASVALMVRGAGSQSGNLTQWQNSTGTVLASVDASGNFTGGTLNSVSITAHAARHQPGGLDALATGTAVDIGSANSAGTGSNLALANHVHAGLNRNANDFSSFTLKTTPVSGDVLLIEDSAAAGVKKYITVGSLPGGTGGTDGYAIHVNASGEINGIAEKTSIVSNDIFVIEDSAATYAKKKVKFSTMDGYNIHKNVSAEVSTLTEKQTLVGTDLLLIEDSADGYSKKKAYVSNLPSQVLPVSSVRRSTSYTVTVGFANVTFDTNDLQTNTAVVNHSTSANTDRIYIYEAGTYELDFAMEVTTTSTSTVSTRYLVNDLTVVPGSTFGDIIYANESDVVGTQAMYTFNAGDYVTAQISTTVNGVGTAGGTFAVKKLQGARGPQGQTGSGSNIIIKDSNINIANTPHSAINIGNGLNAVDSGSGVATVALDGYVPVADDNIKPSTPASGTLLFSKFRAGRHMTAQVGPSGMDYAFQPSIFTNKIGYLGATGNGTTLSTINHGSSATGTATARNIASGSFVGQIRRIGYVSATTAGSSAGIRHNLLQFYRGDAAGRGGFFFVARFGISQTQTGYRWFVGLSGTAAAFGNANPSGLLNLVGIGMDTGDSNIQFMYNDGAGAATKVNLGVSWPRPTANTEFYEFRLFIAPNDTTYYWSLENLAAASLTVIEGDTAASANIPSNTTFLSPQVWINNAATAAAVGIDVSSLYIETDN